MLLWGIPTFTVSFTRLRAQLEHPKFYGEMHGINPSQACFLLKKVQKILNMVIIIEKYVFILFTR